MFENETDEPLAARKSSVGREFELEIFYDAVFLSEDGRSAAELVLPELPNFDLSKPGLNNLSPHLVHYKRPGFGPKSQTVINRTTSTLSVGHFKKFCNKAMAAFDMWLYSREPGGGDRNLAVQNGRNTAIRRWADTDRQLR